jgi:hypothetical protein
LREGAESSLEGRDIELSADHPLLFVDAATRAAATLGTEAPGALRVEGNPPRFADSAVQGIADGRISPTEQTRQAVDDYIKAARKKPGEFLFSGRGDHNRCMTTRQYARLVSSWLATIGLDPHFFGTHSLRRTKATLIYRRTGNLRAVQLLLGHTKIESTVRYLGIEVDDTLAIAEQVDV